MKELSLQQMETVEGCSPTSLYCLGGLAMISAQSDWGSVEQQILLDLFYSAAPFCAAAV